MDIENLSVLHKKEGDEVMSKVKVLNISKSWGSKTKIEGISTVIMNLYGHMDHNKVCFDVANINLDDSIFDDQLRRWGGCVYKLNDTHSKISKIQLCKKLISLIQKNEYDVVYIHVSMGYDAWWMILIRLFTKVPVRIIHSHNAGLNGLRGDKIRKFMNHAMKPVLVLVATDFFACSQKAAEWAFGKRAFKRKGTIIKNAIEYKKFVFSNEVREKIRLQEGWRDEIIVGHVGRISYQKNQEFLIDIICELNQREKARLVLFGGGNEEDIRKLDNKITICNAHKYVQYMGVKSNIYEYLNALDCFVFPSRYEGLGITVVEAQANGLPTICSDHVPREAKTTSLFTNIPLEASVQKWCDVLLQSLKEHKRADTSDEITEGGYDVNSVAKSLQNYLIEEVTQNEK